MTRSSLTNPQAWIGVGVIALSGLLIWGGLDIPSDAGYGGVGPNFLPLVVALGLLVCGICLVWQAVTGGYRDMPDAPMEPADWHATAWVSAGVVANALLLTTVGFVLSCALCFMLAVRGLRLSEGKPAGGVHQTLRDAFTGLAIAAPVFWLFSKLLAINLPSLTSSGWL